VRLRITGVTVTDTPKHALKSTTIQGILAMVLAVAVPKITGMAFEDSEPKTYTPNPEVTARTGEVVDLLEQITDEPLPAASRPAYVSTRPRSEPRKRQNSLTHRPTKSRR